MLEKITAYLSAKQVPFSLTDEAMVIQEDARHARHALVAAMEKGTSLKNGQAGSEDGRGFLKFLSGNIPRKLKEHQIKAALHLIAVRNGANFSVPGSGKTSVVLSVFQWLRSRGELDSLFVVGPPSCFEPWRTEYGYVIGSKPTCEILAGGNVEERRQKYFAGKGEICDLYLTTFQTLQRDWTRVKLLFNQRAVRFALVVDEAHYMKQLDGAWATAVLNVAQYATTRYILTGTPFPYSFVDAFNFFDVLWPQCSPIPGNDRVRIEYLSKTKREAEAAHLLDERIGPLFYRVRKKELGLAPQEFLPPVVVSMNKHERHVYDAIVDKIRNLSRQDYFRDIDLVLRLRRGRMMRLRQCLSYAKLLGTAVSEYNEDLSEGQLSLADVIKHYDALECPAKLDALLQLVRNLQTRGEKVVIWSNFVETLKLITKRLRAEQYGAELIYGATPTENSSVRDELTREKIIAEFVRPSSRISVLVANPAACAESVSLHKECSHAIYYDLSYNCAQYLQSLDRIHRVGGSETRSAHYHFLQYADTFDEDILANVRGKAENMSAIIDRDYPIYSLDMFSADEELAAYERLFR
jgi:SNF2 family DNA or RNA helicase